MSVLNLDTSVKALLTFTGDVPDPRDPAKVIQVSYPCDINGKRLGASDQLVAIYRDGYTGKTFAQVGARHPDGVHFVSPDGSVNGFFIPAPDFNRRETVAAASVHATAEVEPLVPASTLFNPPPAA